MNAENTLAYIRKNWIRAIYRDAMGSGFKGEDLPFSYSSPCIKGEGHYSFFFYWDTYFTNLGLLRHGHAETARNNILNMLWMIQRNGYMPNHVGLYNRSQPPFLCRMVREYIAFTGDETLLQEAAAGLRQEYHFWTTARHSPTGLQRYGHHETAEGCEKFYSGLMKRLGVAPDAPLEEKVRMGGHYIAEAESGWDFNPRFDSRCQDHNTVDLNGLLYEYETWLAEISPKLGWDDNALWLSRAATRRERVNRYLWNDEKGGYFDFDFVTNRPSEVYAASGLTPLATGLASPEQAARVVANLPLLEREHGIAATNERPCERSYQWAYPNTWPPLTYMAVEGLRRNGYEAEARRIAGKFVDTSIRLFQKTGQLWEKTDAVTGDVAGGEYDAAPMLGWSAGVFVALHEYLNTPYLPGASSKR